MKKIIVASIALFIAACGSFKSVTQTEEGTYLQIIGSPYDAVLSLDGSSMDLEGAKSFNLNGKRATKFAIAPGQHRVTIARDGALLVDRQIFVSEGNVFEITLP